MRIVQLANFWTPTSGGLRVSLEHLAAGYAARGHRVLQIVPGPRDHQHLTAWGRRTSVASPRVPGTGYRMIVRLRHVEQLLRAFCPDAIEVSDRATLARTAIRWAPAEVALVLIAHERIDTILDAGSYGTAFDTRLIRPVADRWNPHLGSRVDRVVAPSRYGAEEWHRVGIAPAIVPWGVDTELFHPGVAQRGDGATESDRLRIVCVGRLSAEKRPELALRTLEVLEELAVDAELVMIGDGPARAELAARYASPRVQFLGHIADPRVVASHLAAADVSLSTSGIETFGLSVAESLACGTPVVATEGGAAGELVGDAGRVVPGHPHAVAAAVLSLAARRDVARRARTRAERLRWDHSVDAMLAVHRTSTGTEHVA